MSVKNYRPQLATWNVQISSNSSHEVPILHKTADGREVTIATVRIADHLNSADVFAIVELMAAAPELWRALRDIIPNVSREYISVFPDVHQRVFEAVDLLTAAGGGYPYESLVPDTTDEDFHKADNDREVQAPEKRPRRRSRGRKAVT